MNDKWKYALSLVALVGLGVLLGIKRIDWVQFTVGVGLLVTPSVLQRTQGPPS